MQDDLLGYLLDALTLDARQRVETQLRQDASARDQLQRLRALLAPLAEVPVEEPPPGLALSTLARVAEHQCKLPVAPRAPGSPDTTSWYRFRRIDVLVAACLLILVGGLLAPLIVRQWQGAARLSCQDNLRKFFLSLQSYAEHHDGEFPRVEPEGPRAVAGIFVPVLQESGFLQDVSVDCPVNGHRGPPPITLQHLSHLYNGDLNEFHLAARKLTTNYAYTLGYEEVPGGELHGLTVRSGDGMALLSDVPSVDGRNSPNHGGSGQNVLFVGGHVRWATTPEVGLSGDHIFLNQNKRREAGVCTTDSVLAPAVAGPRLPHN